MYLLLVLQQMWWKTYCVLCGIISTTATTVQCSCKSLNYHQ